MFDGSIFNNYDKNFIFQCGHLRHCSGCHNYETSYQSQLDLKQNHFKNLLSEAQLHTEDSEMTLEWASIGALGHRSRLDFSWQEGRLGLYHREERAIVDILRCEQLSPALQSFYEAFRKIAWPLEKASFRLRVSPTGQRGLWIDCANIDIKKLLDQRQILEDILKQGWLVEMGQRRKILFASESGLKLQDPEHHHWFSTWCDAQEVPLFCQIASFTQPSHESNKLIAKTISDWVQILPQARILEFGSGIGNLTLPAATHAQKLVACEIDELALEGLRQTLSQLQGPLAKLRSKIEIHRGDFQRKLTKDFSEFDLILTNPPRSGLMNFLNPLSEMPEEQRPPYFLYMSCFPESMVKDMVTLKNCGYEIKKVRLVDQFPQTQHYEVLCLLQRKELQST